jgi:hypothetical protein
LRVARVRVPSLRREARHGQLQNNSPCATFSAPFQPATRTGRAASLSEMKFCLESGVGIGVERCLQELQQLRRVHVLCSNGKDVGPAIARL